MPASDLMFGDGDRVVAMGRLVRDADEWWLDPRRILTLADRSADRSGGRSDRAVRLPGADAHVRALKKQDPQAARLWLHVIGRWARAGITVEAIAAGSGRPDLRRDVPADPPGPAPAGGWQVSDPTDSLTYDLGDLPERGIVVAAQPVRYPGDRLVLVIAATDPAAALDHLGPHLPGRLAVVATDVTTADLDEVRSTFEARHQEWRFEHWATDALDEDGQPYAFAELFTVPRDLAAWADSLPAGLVRLDPSVRPALS